MPDEAPAVQVVASARRLDRAVVGAQASWLTALARASGTAREAVACARVVRRYVPGADPIARATGLMGACQRLGECLRLRVHVRGEVPQKPSIVVANHVSYLDPLAIGGCLPLGAVAKSEIMGWPGIGEAVADLGIVFVDRGCAQSGAVALRRMMRLLQAGVSMLVFPEGTTTVGRDVLPFSRGAFGAARILRVPVVPATLRYDSEEVAWVGDASLVPHALRIHRRQCIDAELIFGPSLQPMAFSDASSLAEATRRCIRSLLVP